MLLKFLRKRKNMKMIMWGIAILIIPAFVIWGSGTSDKKKEGNKPDYAGKLFDKKISYDEYGDMWNVARDYAVKTFGNNAPAELIDQLAWDRIILLEDARRRKILVKDSEVVNAIASSPLFQRNGSFDKKLYKSMLGDAARAFEERLRDDLLISKLRETIIGPISISEDEAKKEYRKNFEKIKLSYIVLPFSDFEKDARYAEQDLLSFYDRNKNEFKKPEQVNVGYIEIPFAGFEPDTRVTDDEIKRYFEEHLSEFKKPDSDEAPALDDAIKNEITAKLSFKKKISMAEELAYKTLDEAIAKKELAAPARSNSLEVKETGLFTMQDEIPGIGWSYEFSKSSFDLQPDMIHGALVKTDKAFYIIQMKEKKRPYVPEFNEVKEKVIKAYVKDAAISISKNEAEKILSLIKDEIKNGGSFETAAEKITFTIKSTDFITRNDYIPELGLAAGVADAALPLKDTEISGPVKTLQGWAIVRRDAYQDMDESKFDQEKDEFRERLLSKKKEDVFGAYFLGLKNKAGFISYTNLK